MLKIQPNSGAMTVLLGALTALGPMSMDIYLVSVPSMTEAFHTSVAEVQLTLSLYMAGFALGQLFYGPISDGLGRRSALILGLGMHVIASLVCALTTSIDTLVWARLFQSTGVCGAFVVSRAVVRDLHTRERAARLLSYMGMVTGAAPIIAPIIGSYLHVAFGWRANFVFVTVYGLLSLLAVVFLFAETSRNIDARAMDPQRVVRNFATLLRHRSFVGFACTSACATGALLAFISGASLVFLRVFGYPERDFGFLFGCIMLGNILGAALGSKLVMHYGIERLLYRAVVLSMVAGIGMAALAWAHVDTALAVLLPMFVFMLGFSLVMPQSMAGALSPFPHLAGNASALLGVIQWTFASLVGEAVGILFDGTQRPMAAVIGALSVLTWLAVVLIVRPATAKLGKPHE
jgi:DHA1 family bicyclomycin/chloramphenicol resistance-like MFS transporter